MYCKTLLFFFTFAVLALVGEAKPALKDIVEKAKPKRGLAGLDDFGFNPLFYPNFASSSFDTKGLSPYLFPENKIPTSLDPIFKMSDPEAFRFNLNESPIFNQIPLTFQQYYESLLSKSEFQPLELPQTYLSSEIPHIYQPSSIPQSYKPLELSQAYQPSTVPQPLTPQTYQFSSQQYFKPQAQEEVKPIVEESQD